MRTIEKYHLRENEVVQVLHLKEGAQILHVGVFNHALYLWALIETGARTEDVTIEIHEDRAGIPSKPALVHLGSTPSVGGALMYHVFCRLAP